MVSRDAAVGARREASRRVVSTRDGDQWSLFRIWSRCEDAVVHQIRGFVRNNFMRGGKQPILSAKSSVYNWKSTNPLTLLASYPNRHSQLAWSFLACCSMHFVSGNCILPSTTNAKYFACISAVGGTDPKAGLANPKNATCPSGKTGTKICL